MAIQFLTVDGVEMPAPDTFNWGLQDVSAPDSGRTNDADATMYKMRVTQKRKISLAWRDTDGPTTARILQAFNPEYVSVRYLDPLTDTYQTRTFYTGDRSAPVRQVTVHGKTYTTVSFDIIER